MSWWSVWKRCKYCGHEGIHLSTSTCPYIIGFRRGYEAGRKDGRKEKNGTEDAVGGLCENESGKTEDLRPR